MLDDYFGQFGLRVANSIIAFVAVILCACVIYFLFARRFEQKRSRQKYRYRILYISIVIFVLVMVRIWIEGFTHLFTMLSLVGAGLVIVNKETIMNLAGCLIINWRGFFSEGDFIQISGCTGCVVGINLLYFKVLETTQFGRERATGRTLKIPNSLVITNPVTIMSTDNHLELHQVKYVVDPSKVNPLSVAEDARTTIKSILDEKYANTSTFSTALLAKRNKMLSKMMNFEPTVDLKVMPDKENAVIVETNFYCYAKDAKSLEQALLKQLITSHTLK